MTQLGRGLSEAGHLEDALSVREADLSMRRRLGDSESNILAVQANLACSYEKLGRIEEALQMRRDVYSGRLKLNGDSHEETLLAANNYARSLVGLKRFKEARSLLRSTMPVARRALNKKGDLTLRMRWIFARTLYMDPSTTLDDVREAVTTLGEIERTARRVLGGSYPFTMDIERSLRAARTALRTLEAKAAEAITPGERVTDK